MYCYWLVSPCSPVFDRFACYGSVSVIGVGDRANGGVVTGGSSMDKLLLLIMIIGVWPT